MRIVLVWVVLVRVPPVRVSPLGTAAGFVTIMLFAIMMFYAAMAGVRLAEDEFVERRRIYGAIAIGLVISGIVAVYGAYQLWNLASSLARSNRRRARELRERQVRS